MQHEIAPRPPNRFQRAMQRVARGLFGIDFGVPGANTWEYARQWERGLDLVRDPEAIDKPYAQVGPFQRVVSVLSRDAASVPWEFFKVDQYGEPGDDPVLNHPVAQAWQRPNGYMLGNQLMIGSYISKLVFGEWIWYYPDLQLGKRGAFKALEKSSGDILLLNPMRIKRGWDKKGGIKYAINLGGGKEEPLDADKLTRSARYNPYDPLRGLPLAASIMADLVGYAAAAKWNERFFNENNGVPTVVLVPKEGTFQQQDDRDKFQRRWKQNTGKRRSFGVLPGGWDIKDLGISQRDMDFAELRQFGRDEVLANAGVPPLIAGYLTRPITYNASEQKQLYWNSTINSFVVEEQAVINHDFLPKVGVTERAFPKWEVVKALLENLGEKTEVAVRWFDLGLSKKVINERLEMGWNEKDIEDYDVGYVTFNRIPLGTLFDPSLTTVYMQPVSEATEDENAKDDTASPKDEPEDDEAKGLRSDLVEFRKTLNWRRINHQTRDLETRFDSLVRKHMHEIRDEVLGNVQGTKGWLASRQKQEGDVLVNLVLFDLEASKKKLQKVAGPLQREAMRRGGEGAIFEIGVGIEFNLNDPVAVAELAQLRQNITRIDDTIELALRKSLTEGFNLGESTDQLAKRVREVMDVSMHRSRTIARTEAGHAFNTGRNEGMKQAGVEKHEWISARDNRVRDTHKVKDPNGPDGQTVVIGQPFKNGLRFPNDPSGPPSETINCRCVAVPVLEE